MFGVKQSRSGYLAWTCIIPSIHPLQRIVEFICYQASLSYNLREFLGILTGPLALLGDLQRMPKCSEKTLTKYDPDRTMKAEYDLDNFYL